MLFTVMVRLAIWDVPTRPALAEKEPVAEPAGTVTELPTTN